MQTKTQVSFKAAYFQTRLPPVASVDDDEELSKATRLPVLSGNKGHKVLAYFRTRSPVSSSEELSRAPYFPTGPPVSFVDKGRHMYSREEIITSDMVAVMILSNYKIVDQNF